MVQFFLAHPVNDDAVDDYDDDDGVFCAQEMEWLPVVMETGGARQP